MSNILHLQHCPACSSLHIHPVLMVKDYTSSGEQFPLWECAGCSIRFTQDIPSQDAIGRYYQSSKYISHTDTREGFINKLYHFVRNYTLYLKRKLVIKATRTAKGNLLDVGAGTGAFAASMKLAGWQVTGLEPDDTARRLADKNHQLQLQSPDKLQELPPDNFDAITMWHVLEHVHDLHNYLNNFYRILKPGGRLIVAVPNYTSYDAALYQQYWAAYDVPRHLYHFSPASMDPLMRQHGFEVIDHRAMWFDSFYVSMLSEQYKTGKNNILKAAWNGLLSNIKALNDTVKCSSVIYVIQKQK